MKASILFPYVFTAVVICDLESVWSGFLGVVPFAMLSCVKDTSFIACYCWSIKRSGTQNSERLDRRRALVGGISICETGCQEKLAENNLFIASDKSASASV
ncbi:hypothetical protein EJB05_43540, partial [Eragrostis curvula]